MVMFWLWFCLKFRAMPPLRWSQLQGSCPEKPGSKCRKNRALARPLREGVWRNDALRRVARGNFLRMSVAARRSEHAANFGAQLPADRAVRGKVSRISRQVSPLEKPGSPTALRGPRAAGEQPETSMKNINDPTSGKILVHDNGLGEMTDSEIANRASELAEIDGRSEPNKEDYARARGELRGETLPVVDDSDDSSTDSLSRDPSDPP